MQHRAILVSLAAVALALAFGSAFAKDGNAAAGKTKFAACADCHGQDGNGAKPNPLHAPALAGQYPDYIIQVLHEYKDGQRSNAIMNGMAAPLNEQDIQDIAAYVSGLPSKLSDLHGKIQGGN